MFDFRLKVFHTAAKQLSFSRAAEELFISQPAVSKHIHALENYFKVKLFVRQGSKISLTSNGQVLFQYAEEILPFTGSCSLKWTNGRRKTTATSGWAPALP